MKYHAISYKKIGYYREELFIVKVCAIDVTLIRVVKLLIRELNYVKKGQLRKFKHYEDGIIASSNSFKECCEMAMLEIL